MKYYKHKIYSILQNTLRERVQERVRVRERERDRERECERTRERDRERNMRQWQRGSSRQVFARRYHDAHGHGHSHSNSNFVCHGCSNAHITENERHVRIAVDKVQDRAVPDARVRGQGGQPRARGRHAGARVRGGRHGRRASGVFQLSVRHGVFPRVRRASAGRV